MARKEIAFAAGFATFLIFLCGLSLLAGELAVRWGDGYQLLSSDLKIAVRSANPTSNRPSHASLNYAKLLPRVDGMQLDWYALSPERKSSPPNANLVEAAERYESAGVGPDAVHVFNSRLIKQPLCSDPKFQKFPGFIFGYDAPNNAERPTYRFPLNATSRLGLVTNQFGWRSPPIEVRKSEDTIRIAFVGASTTVNSHAFPFSFPELTAHWLNKWAQSTGLNVKIELINAGREGISPDDIAAIVRDEVLFMSPDIVIFDGAVNPFTPAALVERTQFASPPQDLPESWIVSHSAIARRVAYALQDDEAEPEKPDYKLIWPPSVNEDDPPLDHLDLPSNLTTVLKNIDEINTRVSQSGAELAITSLNFFAYDGMKLNRIRNSGLFKYLNETFYPYRYKDLRRLTNFFNRAYARYSRSNGVLFIDWATGFPRDPYLFADGVHLNYDGVRLQAWIVAQQLAATIRKKITDRTLPRPASSGPDRHPNFPGREHTVVFRCPTDQDIAQTQPLALSGNVSVIAPAEVTPGDILRIQSTADTAPFRYMAVVSPQKLIADLDPKNSFLHVLKADLDVTEGQVLIGILSEDQQKFLATQVVDRTNGFRQIQLPFKSESRQFGSLVISNGSLANTISSVDLKSVSVETLKGEEPADVIEGLVVPAAAAKR